MLDNFLQDTLSPKLVSLDQNLESILTSFQSILSNLRLTSAVPPIQRPSPQSARRDSVDSTAEDWFDAQSVTGFPVEGGLITVVEQETESDHRRDESSEDEDDIAELTGRCNKSLTHNGAHPFSNNQKGVIPSWRVARSNH